MDGYRLIRGVDLHDLALRIPSHLPAHNLAGGPLAHFESLLGFGIELLVGDHIRATAFASMTNG